MAKQTHYSSFKMHIAVIFVSSCVHEKRVWFSSPSIHAWMYCVVGFLCSEKDPFVFRECILHSIHGTSQQVPIVVSWLILKSCMQAYSIISFVNDWLGWELNWPLRDLLHFIKLSWTLPHQFTMENPIYFSKEIQCEQKIRIKRWSHVSLQSERCKFERIGKNSTEKRNSVWYLIIVSVVCFMNL